MIKTVKTDGFSMDYLKFGNGEKPFVIIPGMSVKPVIESHEGIELAYSCFSKDYTVYLFDCRNEIKEGDLTKDMAEKIAKSMKALKISDAYVLGVSHGGMISMLIAARYPNLIKKLVLGSTMAKNNDVSTAIFSKWEQLARMRKRVELKQS